MTTWSIDPDLGTPRAVAMARLQEATAAGDPIIGVGVGCALTGRCAAAAGADLIGLYNSGPLRLADRGSLAGLLAMGSANEIVLGLAAQVGPHVGDTPMVAGLLGADTARPWPVLVEDLVAAGVSGIQNSPSAGLVTGALRDNLEESELGFGAEIELIRRGSAAGFLTCAYVFTPDEADAMVDAGVDVLVVHLGLTAGGAHGAQTTVDLEHAARILADFAARSSRNGWPAILACHGGPLKAARDFAFVAERVPQVRGFFGSSVFERIPLERGVTEAVRAFKSVGALA